MGLGGGGLDLYHFHQKAKSAPFLEGFETVYRQADLHIIFVTHGRKEILKIPVRFLSFLNLKNTISRYILFRKRFVTPLLNGLLPSKIPRFVPVSCVNIGMLKVYDLISFNLI